MRRRGSATEERHRRRDGGRVITRMMVAVGVLVATLVSGYALSLDAARQASAASEQRARAEAVRDRTAQTLKLVLDLETGQRGYLVTGEERFLAPWRAARARLGGALARLQAASSEVGALAEARRFRREALAYLQDYSEPLVAAARRDLQAGRSAVRTGEGKRLMDGLRAMADRVARRATGAADASSAAADRASRRAVAAGTAGILLPVALLLAFLAYLMSAVLQPVRRATAAAGAVRAGDLSARVPVPGSRELGELAEAFNSMAAALQANEAELRERHDQLEAARREAEDASRAKNEFLSRMSHELRTPLNAILGFAQILELDGRRSEEAAHILKAGRHLLELINEVLDIARIESGDMRVSLEPVSVSEILREAADLVAPLSTAAGIRLRADVQACEGLHVLADRQRLKQVMLNLLANAVKYNRVGGSIHVGCEAGGADALRLVVSDTGIGIAREDLERLFRPFERLVADDDAIEGTGLGLALTKRLVEVMNGRVTVQSEIGKGSVFCVELARADAPAHGAPAIAPHRGAEDARPRVSRAVLYIEDNASNLKLMEAVLARRPEIQLMVAIQGTIGLELAFEHRPSLVLLDLGLPDMSGREVLRRLRADPRTARTRVVVVSADATASQVERLRMLGATDYLSKPFDIERLLQVVDEAAGAGEEDEAPGAPPHTPLDPGFVRDLQRMEDASPEQAEALHDLIRLFIDDAGARLARLKEAARRADYATTSAAAHMMIGSSGSVGAFALADLCRELEQAAGRREDVDALVARVEAEFEQVADALGRTFGSVGTGRRA